MKAIVFLLIVVILGGIIWYYISTNQSGKPASSVTIVTDTMVVVKDSIINANSFDTIPLGFYQGMMPCKNCEGVQRTILFSGDEHFTMEELNWGQGTLAKRTEGTWEKSKGKFLLYKKEKVMAEYRLSKDSLINTENNGTRIPDSMSKQYVLFKKNTAPENMSWKKRKSEGVDIVGNGTDPYWSVEIDNEKFIMFKLAAAAKPVIVPIEKPVITRDSTVYSLVTEGGAAFRISIYSRFCHDGIGDHLYEYKMTVFYKGQTYNGCAIILNNAGKDQ